MSEKDFEITKNIKLIEMLKVQILAAIADLYGNLANFDSDLQQRGDILVDIIIMTYMLSSKLGISYTALDLKAVKKLKLGALENNQSMPDEISALLKHLNRTREF